MKIHPDRLRSGRQAVEKVHGLSRTACLMPLLFLRHAAEKVLAALAKGLLRSPLGHSIPLEVGSAPSSSPENNGVVPD